MLLIPTSILLSRPTEPLNSILSSTAPPTHFYQMSNCLITPIVLRPLLLANNLITWSWTSWTAVPWPHQMYIFVNILPHRLLKEMTRFSCAPLPFSKRFLFFLASAAWQSPIATISFLLTLPTRIPAPEFTPPTLCCHSVHQSALCSMTLVPCSCSLEPQTT